MGYHKNQHYDFIIRNIYIYIYINNLDDNIKSNVLKFADDANVFRKVNNDGDKQYLKNDLKKLVK